MRDIRLSIDLRWVWFSAYGDPVFLSTLVDRLWGLMEGTEKHLELLPWRLAEREGRLDLMGGLLPLILDEADARSLPSPLRQMNAMGIDVESAVQRLQLAGFLHPYQGRAVVKLLLAPLGRGIADVAVGGGKTRIATALIAVGASIGTHWWAYGHPSEELARQAQSEVSRDLPGMLACLDLEEGDVTYVCRSYTKLLVGGTSPALWRGLICDEGHRLGAAGMAKAAAEVSAVFRLGLSGSPLDRGDARNVLVQGLTGPVVYKIKVRDVEKAGGLASGKVEGA